METYSEEKILKAIIDILDSGGEAVVRKRSKNGEKYIEVVEQNFKTAKKYKAVKI